MTKDRAEIKKILKIQTFWGRCVPPKQGLRPCVAKLTHCPGPGEKEPSWPRHSGVQKAFIEGLARRLGTPSGTIWEPRSMETAPLQMYTRVPKEPIWPRDSGDWNALAEGLARRLGTRGPRILGTLGWSGSPGMLWESWGGLRSWEILGPERS